MKVYIVSDNRAGEWFLFPQAVFSTREKADTYAAAVKDCDLGLDVEVREWEIDKTDDAVLKERKQTMAQ